MPGNFIKIDRKILKWEWYKNTNTKVMFFHCLLKANWKDGKFEGQTIPRGSFVTSLPKLANETQQTIQQVRTSLDHLKSTGEITVKATNKYRIITVNNYDLYQADNRQDNSQSTDKQQTTNRQLNSQSTAIEEYKESKESEEVEESKENIYLTESNDSVCQTEVRQVLEAWNTLNICPVKRINSQSQRYKMLTARLREYGIDDVLKAIDQVKASDFLKGGNSKGWTITFDWFVRPNNFPKVLEGNYSNKSGSKQNDTHTIPKDMSYSEWRILHNG